MSIVKVVGFDPSLNNWGIAYGRLNLRTGEFILDRLGLIQPTFPSGKQVRHNSRDLERAYQLTAAAMDAASDAHLIFAEIPTGSQSARAMASYGICIGVLGALRAMGKPFYEVTPTEVKLAGPGIRNATKQQMIEWAVSTYPEAPWLRHRNRGELVLTASNEHLADAVAAIHAGVKSNTFQQALPMLRALSQSHSSEEKSC